MGALKTENAVLCASSLHTSAGAMDRNGGDPVHEISIAERVARGSAQPRIGRSSRTMMAGPGAARLMDTLLGILRRAALIDEADLTAVTPPLIEHAHSARG